MKAVSTSGSNTYIDFKVMTFTSKNNIFIIVNIQLLCKCI